MITLVLGGARSGKSVVAERMAARSGASVTYVATLVGEDDPRVRAHQARRPASWHTVECDGDLAALLEATPGFVLVDSLGPWLANRPSFDVALDRFVAALERRLDDTIVVSDEVGLSVHPESALGRDFRDALGSLNQAVAAAADDVWLVVAGRAIRLPPYGAE